MDESGQKESMESSGGDAEEKPLSAKVLHHIIEPAHLGEMDKPDGRAVVTGPCGDTDEFSLRIFRDQIREIRFRTTGCFFTIAACDALATIAEGGTIDEGLRITQESILEYLGGLPDDHKHCALLAANTLHKALQAYLISGKDV